MTNFKIPTESEFIEADGIRYAYRKFGTQDGTPVVFLVHFRGTMENWDPNMLEPIANTRPVILFDNKGVGETDGQTPTTIAEMAQDAGTFIKALGLTQVDILGFSIGGMVAQELALQEGNLVRRIIMAGTSPESGINPNPEIFERMNRHGGTEEDGINDFMFFFYEQTETSISAGMASLQRIFNQKKVNSSEQVKEAQLQAIAKWAKQKSNHDYEWLQNIKHPVLVTNGVNDVMVPTKNSYILAEKLPKAQLIIYPDSGHGHLFQFPELFAENVNSFLDSNSY
ncbi:alpha/beta hydrolase [Priestia aryabhattai]|jgi:pimeloyl-ACP methyl ester carboxylesterase|uniref:alpha/beta fold hydrolase n=1 Tax=Priestia TaxID=2800373 RepID=UPI001EB15637|nr:MULTISPECIES: alpha/beta hydrolase [Priestia]MBY0089445.1 alpha/beta hydrolase [Priestia aryabhattai]MBY0100966.1 alpha/beta hydrolase [Priestia aryabhattai]MCM3304110.1 alpha/beta hydrolase [Priestia megaterium]